MNLRSHPSRPSTSLPQGSTPLSSTPISSKYMPQHSMQPQYPASQSLTLPPLQPHHPQSPAPHHYMGQTYQPDLSRFRASMYMPQHSIQPQYPVSQSLTLPPLQHHHPQSPAPHHYMGQTYQPGLSRFPASTQDVYPASTAPAMPQRTACSLQLSPLLSVTNPQAQVHSQYHPPLGGLALASTAQSHPQPIAPAPPRDCRPGFNGLPSGAFSYPNGEVCDMAPDLSGANGSRHAEGPLPTQVVGFQDRPSIWPNVPGRATPAKGADEKFPCPHCNKNYLHAKHLKRHLLRHTGDRPYRCVLCKDTFSRSDVLKRHFQKCSSLHGNPTGATHLSFPRAHLKRSQQHAAATTG